MRRIVSAILFFLCASAAFGQVKAFGPQKVFPNTVTSVAAPTASWTACGSNNTSNFYSTAPITTTCTATSGGRLIIVSTSNTVCGAAGGLGSVTDGSSNTWAIDLNDTQAGCILSAPVTTTLASGGTVTLHCFSGSCNASGFLYYMTPAVSSGGVEGTAHANTGFSSSLTVTASAATTATDYCVVELNTGGNDQGATFSGGFTALFTNTSGQGGQFQGAAYGQFSSGLTPAATNTFTASDGGAMGIACYKQ
jgi:hypothetical protein